MAFNLPPPVDSWRFPGAEEYFAPDNENGMLEYYDKRDKDMRACGIDPVMGDSLYAESSLCMEKKGWYEKKVRYVVQVRGFMMIHSV